MAHDVVPVPALLLASLRPVARAVAGETLLAKTAGVPAITLKGDEQSSTGETLKERAVQGSIVATDTQLKRYIQDEQSNLRCWS